jgi:hypothetical protein
MKLPGAMEQVQQTGKFILGDKEFDFGEALKRYVITSGIQDGEKIVRDAEVEINPQEQMMKMQQMEAQIMEMTEAIKFIAQQTAQSQEPNQPLM